MRLYQYKDVIGNGVSVSLLKRAVMNGSLPNFIIMHGSMGTGKSTCAEITSLSMTCKNPKDGEPCLECDNCKRSIRALQTTGVSLNIVKKNMAVIDSKKDMNDLIKEIFVLKGTFGNSVYLFEELHELDKSKQTTLLEEIDRLDPNTYVIATTTRLNRLLPELRSRALSFSFTQLNKPELKLLFDRTAKKLGMGKVSPVVEAVIMRHARGIPRDLVKIMDFVVKNRPTEAEIVKFLNYVGVEEFLDVLQSMRGSMFDLSRSLNNLMSSHSLDVVVYQMKEFLATSLFLVEGEVNEEFTPEQVKAVKEIITPEMSAKVASLASKLDAYSFTEADLRLSMIALRQLVQGKKTAHILAESKREAAVQQERAASAHREEKELDRLYGSGEVGKVTLTSIMNAFGGNNSEGKDS